MPRPFNQPPQGPACFLWGQGRDLLDLPLGSVQVVPCPLPCPPHPSLGGGTVPSSGHSPGCLLTLPVSLGQSQQEPLEGIAQAWPRGSKHPPCPRLAELPEPRPFVLTSWPHPSRGPALWPLGTAPADPLSSIFTPGTLAKTIYIICPS